MKRREKRVVKKCERCGESYLAHDEHKCPPRWCARVEQERSTEGFGSLMEGEEEGQDVFAASPRKAAVLFVERLDAQRAIENGGARDIASGQRTMRVEVKPLDMKDRLHVYEVSGEWIPVYRARRVMMSRTLSAQKLEDTLGKQMGAEGLVYLRQRADRIASEAGSRIVGRSHLQQALQEMKKRNRSDKGDDR